ncbi:hypothetical protein MQE23_08340 [Streptomyces sp. HP-A2021]|uniref:hypothetical protein n=1 Tax=Streptomyces sp. HP-A2021 TaxID=2927875 RepID=UPI001FB01454|nr:hypothetical protein [Streptomyces sp. HP-A2021]UOB09059.1 hypothetical protein MQE23_08340 [Streptomyces sp. HP-A2021]
MAELTYPHYRLTANGRNETGFTVTLQIQEGAGGPLPEQSVDTVLAGLRALLQNGDDSVSTELVRFSTTTTYL